MSPFFNHLTDRKPVKRMPITELPYFGNDLPRQRLPRRWRRLQNGQWHSVLGYRYLFALDDTLKKLGQMSFGFIGANGIHNITPLIRPASDQSMEYTTICQGVIPISPLEWVQISNLSPHEN